MYPNKLFAITTLLLVGVSSLPQPQVDTAVSSATVLGASTFPSATDGGLAPTGSGGPGSHHFSPGGSWSKGSWESFKHNKDLMEEYSPNGPGGFNPSSSASADLSLETGIPPTATTDGQSTVPSGTLESPLAASSSAIVAKAKKFKREILGDDE